MNPLKMLVVAVIAAVAAIALLGASDASATIFCKTAPQNNDCPDGWHWPANTPIHLSLSETFSHAAGTSNTCTETTTKGRTTNTGSSVETINMVIESITYAKCTCQTNVITNGALEFHHKSGTNDATYTGKNHEVTMNCAGVSCIYGTSSTGTNLGTLTASATGTSAAVLDLEATVPKKSGGFLCPSTATWAGQYTFTEPKPLYITDTLG